MRETLSPFAVIGAGRWGGTLAWLISHEIGVPVRLYDTADVIKSLRKTRKLGNSDLSGCMVWLTDKLDWVLDCGTVFIAINASHFGELLTEIKQAGISLEGKLVVLCMKGMDTTGLFLPEQLAAAALGCDIAVMGGPCQPLQLFDGTRTTMSIATNGNYSDGATAEDLCNALQNRPISFEPSESVIGAAVCGVSKNILAFVGGMLDAYGWAHKKPLLEQIFMEEARRMIKAFDEDTSIINGPFYAGDNKVTLYYDGSKNVVGGRNLIEHGFVTPCEAIDAAMPFAIRLSELGLSYGFHGWAATVIANAEQCRTPTKAALRSRLRYYAKLYQLA